MNVATKGVLAVLGSLALGSSLLGTMHNQKSFMEKYPNAKATRGKCTTCHVKSLPTKTQHEANAYGRDLAKKAVIDPNATSKSYDYTRIETLDSDGDGIKNLDEIKAGTNPGDPTSK